MLLVQFVALVYTFSAFYWSAVKNSPTFLLSRYFQVRNINVFFFSFGVTEEYPKMLATLQDFLCSTEAF